MQGTEGEGIHEDILDTIDMIKNSRQLQVDRHQEAGVGRASGWMGVSVAGWLGGQRQMAAGLGGQAGGAAASHVACT